jgi:predicted nuclease of predicted toxin-antitoxin system
MIKYLIDVNLPYYFSLWNSPNYQHQSQIDAIAKDSIIWSYAEANDLTIITKDSDFSNRMLIQSPPPRVIHIRLGNISLKDFHRLLDKRWQTILLKSKKNKLVYVFEDFIQAVN